MLPSFAAALYQIYQFLTPIREILSESIASADKRASERYRNFLIDSALTEEQQNLRSSFLYKERVKALVASNNSPDKIIEEQGKQFAKFLKILENPPIQQVSQLIEKIFCLNDFCQFDYNSFFANFDPAFKTHKGQESTVENPSFKPVEVAEIIPQLMDILFLISRLDISKQIVETVAILEGKRANEELSAESISRIDRIFQAVLWLLQKKYPEKLFWL